MINYQAMEMAELSDSELVAHSLSGSREAFGRIVARYQSLICSINYSATGNLNQSEDLAQETFLVAWKDLSKLREPAKLRSWLCTISRNLTCDVLRKQGREPSHAAGSLDEVQDVPAPEPAPAERAMSREEQEILWRSIEKIPELYREPLVLFYREHQSIEAVAQNLELSEDAVKQRLSRGRKLLHEQVLAFVEGALERTSPGKVFTISVLAALPAMTISAKAATLGAAAAKGSASAKAAGTLGMLGALLSPVLGFFGMWIGYRTSMAAAESDRERDFNRRFFKRLGACIGGFFLLYFVLMFWGGPLVTTNTGLFVSLVIGLALAYVIAMVFYSIWCYRERKKLLSHLTPAERAANPCKAVWEYRSRFHLLGLPFIHIRIGDRLGEPLKAWIAIGDCALGVLFAFGGLAVAPVSVGGCAVGLFSFGGMSIGALALGGLALGGWAFGGLAIGWQSYGGCAIAWHSAWGGYAIAHYFALGGIGHAAQANEAAVQTLLRSNPFFKISEQVRPHLFWTNLVWLIPMIIQRSVVARKRRQQAAANL